MKRHLRKWTMRMLCLAALFLAAGTILPAMAADAPKPDPTGANSGTIADTIGAAVNAPTDNDIKMYGKSEPLALKLGDVIEEPLEPVEFGRIGACEGQMAGIEQQVHRLGHHLHHAVDFVAGLDHGTHVVVIDKLHAVIAQPLSEPAKAFGEDRPLLFGEARSPRQWDGAVAVDGIRGLCDDHDARPWSTTPLDPMAPCWCRIPPIGGVQIGRSGASARVHVFL